MKKISSMYKPYVYKRAEDLGIPMQDSTTHIKIVVTNDDVVRAQKANSKHCALARSALRLPGVNAAYFFRQIAFIEYPDAMVRFQLPPSVQKEIVAFDRAGVFAAGIYQLSPMPPSATRPALDRRNKRKRKQRRIEQRQTARAGLTDAIARIQAAEPPPADTPEQRRFEQQVSKVVSKHIGDRTVSGIKSSNAPEPLPGRAPTRYVHRTQYVRNLRDPDRSKP